MNSDKIIINISGGVMSSIFSVGVLAELEKEDIYEKVEAIYAGSAGAVIASYFLARQMSQAKKIYSQDLSKTLYLPENIPGLIKTAIISRFYKRVNPEKFPKIISLDAIKDLLTSSYPLDVEYLKEQPIPLYASYLNIDTGEVDYLDIRKGDVVENLLGAINAVPGCYENKLLHGKRYIDGAVKEPFSVKVVTDRHPNSKILMIANENIDRPFANRIKGVGEGLIAEWMLGVPVYSMFANREKIVTRDFKLIEENKNIHLANLPIGDVRKRYSKDPKKLEKFFEIGIEKGREAMEFIRR